MSYLQISNKGEVSPHALSLMGASTKRGNSGQIGFFGTGNKYALAKFLREGLSVVIHSGNTPITVDTHDVTMDDQSFSIVRVDGRDTSITTDMGPTWALWQAVREVYSNALDGGDADIRIVDEPSSREGYTNYHVEANSEIHRIMGSFDQYFSTARTVSETNSFGDIFENGTGTVYRHGIRCIPEGGRSMFDYQLGDIAITEERLVQHNFQLGTKVWGCLLSSNNAQTIAKAFRVSTDTSYIEGLLAESWGVDFPATVSDAVIEWLSENLVADNSMSRMMTDAERMTAVMLPAKLLSHLSIVVGRKNMVLPRKLRFNGDVAFTPVNLSKADVAMLKDALHVISNSGIEIQYSIIAASFSDDGMLGCADVTGQRIILSETVFSMGQTIIIGTILEEWIHLKHGVKDETRPMQDAILNEFATVLQSMAGIKEQAA